MLPKGYYKHKCSNKLINIFIWKINIFNKHIFKIIFNKQFRWKQPKNEDKILITDILPK